MVGVTVAPMAMGDPVRYAQIATLSAFVAAAMCIVAWLLRLSTLINIISETVMLGFKAGAGLSIAATQIPALLGIPGGAHNFIERVLAIASQAVHAHALVMGIGFASLALLWLGEKFLPSRPVALFLVVISVAFMSMTNLAGHVVMGKIPVGLPSFSPPILRMGEVDGIVPLAFADCCCLTWRVSQPRAHSLPSMATRSMYGKNSWVSEAPIFSSLSDKAIRLQAASLNPR